MRSTVSSHNFDSQCSGWTRVEPRPAEIPRLGFSSQVCRTPNGYGQLNSPTVSSQDFDHEISNGESRMPEPLLALTSKCPLNAQLSQGLGPFFQIELLKTSRISHLMTRNLCWIRSGDDQAARTERKHATQYCLQSFDGPVYSFGDEH